MKTATKSRPTAAPEAAVAAGVGACQHHWLLGQPNAGQVPAVCRKCGTSRAYPAVLDDLDPPGEPDKGAHHSEDVATAAGGARPSSVSSAPRKL